MRVHAVTGYLLLLSFVFPAPAQQPAASSSAPGARAAPGGRGGGFSEPDPIDFEDHSGWDGDKNYWRAQDGAIVVESTCEKPAGTIYLVWQGGERRSEAARVIEHRTKHGSFKSIDDLKMVAGVDPARIETKKAILVF